MFFSAIVVRVNAKGRLSRRSQFSNTLAQTNPICKFIQCSQDKSGPLGSGLQHLSIFCRDHSKLFLEANLFSSLRPSASAITSFMPSPVTKSQLMRSGFVKGAFLFAFSFQHQHVPFPPADPVFVFALGIFCQVKIFLRGYFDMYAPSTCQRCPNISFN